jgi:hypothetical protein
MSAELLKYVRTIYHSMEEVPEAAMHSVPITEEDRQDYESFKKYADKYPEGLEQRRRMVESGRRMLGFKKGMKLGWTLESSGPFWMRCKSSHWVGVLGAEGREDIHIWVLGRWFRIYNAYVVMS